MYEIKDIINKINCADCLEFMKKMPENSVDTIITDPPYGLGFMNKEWDDPKKQRELMERESKRSEQRFKDGKSPTTASFSKSVPPGLAIKGAKEGKWFQEWCEQWSKEALRIIKPGGTLLSFCAPRMYHRMACGIEDAGWQIRDCIIWLYGSGFPKATDISKQLDKTKGLKRTGIIKKDGSGSGEIRTTSERERQLDTVYETGEPISDEAKLWNGWKSHGLKPAYEPIIVAMAPNEGSYAENALKHGVSGLNIDGGRIPSGTEHMRGSVGAKITESDWKNKSGFAKPFKATDSPLGRFPSNIILECICDEVIEGKVKGTKQSFKANDYKNEAINTPFKRGDFKGRGIEKTQIHTNPECPCAMLDKQSGERKGMSSQNNNAAGNIYRGQSFVNSKTKLEGFREWYNDKGGASRFYKIIGVDEDYSFMLQLDICGITLENQRVAIILNGVKKEIEKYTLGVEQFLCGKNKTENFQKDIVSTIKMVTKLMTELKILNVLPEKNISTFMQENEKTIKLLKGLNVENVRDVKNISHLIAFKNEVLQLIKDIVKNVKKKNLENGEEKTENIGTNITENIAKRFLYCPKSSKSERNLGCEELEAKNFGFSGGANNAIKNNKDEYLQNHIGLNKVSKMTNNHPTVKPLKLMEYLCTLTKTPYGGVVLDPFLGSGTTGIACINTDRDFIGIEKELEYVKISEARVNRAIKDKKEKNRQGKLL